MYVTVETVDCEVIKFIWIGSSTKAMKEFDILFSGIALKWSFVYNFLKWYWINNIEKPRKITYQLLTEILNWYCEGCCCCSEDLKKDYCGSIECKTIDNNTLVIYVRTMCKEIG